MTQLKKNCTDSECVSLALSNQHAKGMRYIILPVSGCTELYLINETIFRKEDIEIKM